MVMKSRFCSTFTKLISKSFMKSVPSISNNNNNNNGDVEWVIKFTTSHWEPYIDRSPIARKSNESIVCGPLLGLLIEVANSLNVNITLMEKSGDYFQLLHQGEVHILLSPMFPYAMRNITTRYQVGSPLGNAPMFSILASEHHPDDSLGLRSFSAFNGPFILLYFLTWLTVNLLSMLISPHEYFHQRFGSNLFRMAMRQPAIGNWFNTKAKTSALVLNFLFLTIFFDQFVSNVFLNLLTVEPLVDRVESVEDLVARPDVKLCVFAREISVPLLKELSQKPFYANFQSRIFPQSPAGQSFHQWTDWVIDEVSNNRMVLISEKLYLDYLQKHYMQLSYRNLHRSAINQFNFPFFLAVKRANQSVANNANPELNAELKNEVANLNRLQNSTDRIIGLLVESGIFEYWIRESLYLNQPPNSVMSLGQDDYFIYNYDRNYVSSIMSTVRIEKDVQSYRVLDYDDVSIIFSMYVVANLLASMVMIVEFVIDRIGLLDQFQLSILTNIIYSNPLRLDRRMAMIKKRR